LNNQIQNDGATKLAIWLKVATQGLPPLMKTRITTEIADHFAEVYAEYVANGFNNQAAETAALQQLGEAETFRRSYYTAHFSQRRYRIGFWASLSWFGLLLIGYFGHGTFADLESHHQLLWQTVMDITSASLLLTIVHVTIVLLRERYEIRLPRLVQAFFATSILLVVLGCMFAIWPTWINPEVRLLPFQFSRLGFGAALTVSSYLAWLALHRGGYGRGRWLALLALALGTVLFLDALVAINVIHVNSYYIRRYYIPFMAPTLLSASLLVMVLLLLNFRVLGSARAERHT
jgi:hypothetical protein